jgi:hypothetical protein
LNTQIKICGLSDITAINATVLEKAAIAHLTSGLCLVDAARAIIGEL